MQGFEYAIQLSNHHLLCYLINNCCNRRQQVGILFEEWIIWSHSTGVLCHCRVHGGVLVCQWWFWRCSGKAGEPEVIWIDYVVLAGHGLLHDKKALILQKLVDFCWLGDVHCHCDRLSSWEVSTVALWQHDEFLKNAHVFQFWEFSVLPSTSANSHWVSSLSWWVHIMHFCHGVWMLSDLALDLLMAWKSFRLLAHSCCNNHPTGWSVFLCRRIVELIAHFCIEKNWIQQFSFHQL